MLELKAILEGGEKINLKILIDTGAEANLISTGLVSQRYTRPAHKILELVVVNGQVLQGGTVLRWFFSLSLFITPIFRNFDGARFHKLA